MWVCQIKLQERMDYKKNPRTFSFIVSKMKYTQVKDSSSGKDSGTVKYKQGLIEK